MKKTKTKAVAVRAARTLQETEQLLGEIGVLQRSVTTLEQRMNDELAGIKAKYEAEVAPLNEGIEQKFEALRLYAEAHRDELCPQGKTAKLATGELRWRLPPPSVSIRGQDVVLERLRNLGLEQFIRTKEEVNKEAVLADPEAVEGVRGITIKQEEHFIAKPFESQLERVGTTSRG